MKPLTLQEFAEDMRRKGDIRNADLADEILGLIDIEADVAEPYSDLCDDLRMYAPDSMAENPPRMAEWLGDRSNLLAEIEEQLEKADRGVHDADDAVKELIGTLAEAEAILEAHGWNGEGDFLDAVRDMTSPIDRMEYDL